MSNPYEYDFDAMNARMGLGQKSLMNMAQANQSLLNSQNAYEQFQDMANQCQKSLEKLLIRADDLRFQGEQAP